MRKKQLDTLCVYYNAKNLDWFSINHQDTNILKYSTTGSFTVVGGNHWVTACDTGNCSFIVTTK